MKKHGSVTIEVTEIKLIICNMCGCDIDKSSNPYVDNHISIEKMWYYGSPFDGELHNIDLCLECYLKLLQIMKISPNLE